MSCILFTKFYDARCLLSICFLLSIVLQRQKVVANQQSAENQQVIAELSVGINGSKNPLHNGDPASGKVKSKSPSGI